MFIFKQVIKKALSCLTEKQDEQINQITKDMMLFWMKMTSVQVFI